MFPSITIHLDPVRVFLALLFIQTSLREVHMWALKHPHGRIDRLWCRLVMRPLLRWVSVHEERKP
jgi:hypothetical protein